MHAVIPHASLGSTTPGHLYMTVFSVALQADLPVPKRRRVYYFELTVQDTGHKGMITMGFTHAGSQSNKQPGWADISDAVSSCAQVAAVCTGLCSSMASSSTEASMTSAAGATTDASVLRCGINCRWEPNTYAYHGDDGKVGIELAHVSHAGNAAPLKAGHVS